nr:retrovirus-related Pol polyprotein from transposon TNT 1-94 [Tanacetum cinerariifolium]
MSYVRTPQQNGVVKRRNRTLVEAARTMLIFSRPPLFLWAEAIATACFTQNRSIIHRRFNKTPYELINGRKPESFLYVFGVLYYPKNDREDIGDIGFFIGYSANSCAYKIYNRRTKKLMEIMNVSFDELSAIAFEQCSELDLLFEAMYDDYIGGQPSATARTVPPAQEPQVHQTSTASTTIADTAQTPTNSSFHATNIPITSHDVDELNSNAMVDGNTFVNPFANPSTSAAESSYSQNVDQSNMHTFYQPYPHEFQWTKDHPLKQNKHDEEQMVIRNKSRLVVRGYRQEKGIDFKEPLAPVARISKTKVPDSYFFNMDARSTLKFK